MNEVIPVIMKNRNGMNLYGMLHVPDDSARRSTGIILLSPGIKSRIAPHRLYVKMARHYASTGYVVLRFDYHGLGDSEGDVKEEFVADFYGSIQRGRYVDDVLAAMDYMKEQQAVGQFVVGGLCGGAITGLAAASNDQRIVGLLGLGIPVILDGSDVDHSISMTEGQANRIRNAYINKILSPSAWKRFISFNSDYREIYRLFFKKSKDKPVVRSPGSSLAATGVKLPENVERAGGNFNPLFPVIFHKMISTSRKMLLIFSDMDRLYWEFDEKFWKPYSDVLLQYQHNVEIRVLKDANHILSFTESQKEMLNLTGDWLSKNYG